MTVTQIKEEKVILKVELIDLEHAVEPEVEIDIDLGLEVELDRELDPELEGLPDTYPTIRATDPGLELGPDLDPTIPEHLTPLDPKGEILHTTPESTLTNESLTIKTPIETPANATIRHITKNSTATKENKTVKMASTRTPNSVKKKDEKVLHLEKLSEKIHTVATMKEPLLKLENYMMIMIII